MKAIPRTSGRLNHGAEVLPGPESRARLPALAFGHAGAQTHTRTAELDRQLGKTLGISAVHAASEAVQAFASRSAAVELAGVRLLALASSAVVQRTDAADHAVVVVPLQGSATVLMQGRTLEVSANESAVLLPPEARTARLDVNSCLWMELEPTRLTWTAAAMLARDDDPRLASRLLGLDAPTTLPLRVGRAHLGNVFRQLCRLLDEYAADAQLLRLSASDDAFCRAVVTLLAPGHVLHEPQAAAPSAPGSNEKLDRVCDHLLARLDCPLSLTDMERLSGLSVRSLQYAFQHRFGCSPRKWFLEQRLLAARAELCAGRDGTTVTQVAVRYFSNMGRFSTQYRTRFGELPMATLARARARALRG